MGFFYFIGSFGAENWDYDGLSVELLQMIGKGYVIDHCVSLFKKKQEKKLYQIYVTDTLKLINDNIAKNFGGAMIKTKYSELTQTVKEDNRTGDEVAREVIGRLGLKVKGQKQ